MDKVTVSVHQSRSAPMTAESHSLPRNMWPFDTEQNGRSCGNGLDGSQQAGPSLRSITSKRQAEEEMFRNVLRTLMLGATEAKEEKEIMKDNTIKEKN